MECEENRRTAVIAPTMAMITAAMAAMMASIPPPIAEKMEPCMRKMISTSSKTKHMSGLTIVCLFNFVKAF